MLDRFDLKAQSTKINGTLFPNKDGGSVSRQMPNNASDDIWTEWELSRAFPITAEEIRRMGKDPLTAAKLEDDVWGLGDDAYVGIFDVYHQLHCLNTLRKIAYPDYYDNPTHFDPKSKMHAIHVNHCVDILMQAIQCSGNVNFITMHWVETQTYPFPDMSINRQCVEFDGMTQWRHDNTIDMDKYLRVMKKPDEIVNQLPAPDEYYHYYMPNTTNPNHMNGANPDEDFNL